MQPRPRSTRRVALLVSILVAILVTSYTPIASIFFHLAGQLFVAISPPDPLPAPRHLYARVGGVPVHGVGDDSQLWIAIAVLDGGPDVAFSDSNVLSKFSSIPSESSQHSRGLIVLCRNREHPLFYNGNDISVTADTTVILAIDSCGRKTSISTTDFPVDEYLRVGSSRTSIPPSMQIGADTDFFRVIQKLRQPHQNGSQDMPDVQVAK